MKKTSTTVTYTLKNETSARFNEYAEQWSINRSAFVDKAINKELDEIQAMFTSGQEKITKVKGKLIWKDQEMQG